MTVTLNLYSQGINPQLAFKINSFTKHSLSAGSDSKAIAYIEVEPTAANTSYASIKALLSAVNRRILFTTNTEKK